MDMKRVKQRLEAMEKNSNTSSDSDGPKVKYFKPKVGKQVIRIVPSKFDKDFPFTEIPMYFEFDGRPFPSPELFGEKDPIVAFAKELRDTHQSKEWKLANKIDPKTRIFAPIIVRGEEDKGVQLWQFGKLVYQEFLNLGDDAEVGDYTDVLEGRDIKLTTVGPEVTGTTYNKTSISPSMKTSPLSTNKDEVQLWLEEQTNPKEINTPLSYDEVKAKLGAYLEKLESEEEGEVSSEKHDGFDSNVKPHRGEDLGKPESDSKRFDKLFPKEGDNQGQIPDTEKVPF